MRIEARFPVVGLGASAGGVQALEGFFTGLRDGGGMAFVIVTHLSPDRASLLHQVIARHTSLPVQVAGDGMPVEPGHIYVMPENSIMTMAEGCLSLQHPNAARRERKPIDIFFSSLAKDQGEYAVGIVLSGGDGDGTLGIKAVKEHGGLTLAQVHDASGPQHPDMPESAIASGLVDYALPAEEMGGQLAEFAHSFELLGSMTDGGDDLPEQDFAKSRDTIYAILRKQTGHDFSGYKAKTFIRRIQRRMQVTHLATLKAYAQLLQTNTAEVANLFRDLLINVTSFFRDEGAFDSLQKLVVPKLFEGKGANDTVRVWVPGCATGEEVFSIAILLREYSDTLPTRPRVQVFATDIDEPALGVARAARYPESLLDGVSQERRDRFFVRDGASCVLAKDVRDMCIFSPHSVIRDPPFSRMDLVSCRNLLIYFGPQIQLQVIPTFHYALRPGGYLFLGTSENIGQYGDLFAPLDKKQRLFQRRDHAGAPVRIPASLSRTREAGSTIEPVGIQPGRGAVALRQMIEGVVLDRFAPAYVVVNSEGEAVYYSARTGKYLEAPQGVPNRQLIAMARKGLRLDLRSALREAMESRQTAVRDNVAVEEADGRVQAVRLTVEPVPAQGEGEPLFLILFADLGPAVDRQVVDGMGRRDPDATMADLERELRDTREILQSTIEEYETALEELKSSNEELVSVNEEAQSANEELEASKEEMQSLNEELSTINAELGEKVDELDHAHNDLKNLFDSTQIATIFLDRNLVIRSFTPAASSFFNLIPTDIGRPLTDLASHLAYPDMREHIHRVFESGETVEHRIARNGGREHFLVRLLPYRDADGKVRGVVATFVDVTLLTEAEQHQRTLISELNHRVKNMLAVVIAIAERTSRTAASTEAYREALVGRLRSMARSYELLARETWKDASVHDLVRQELSPFGLDHVTFDGPEVRLRPRAGLSLGMVLHELATNAAKYGALSHPEGRVALEWAVDGQNTFSLTWREQGGTGAAEPITRGFGLTLVDREIGYNLKGMLELEQEPDGLSVRLRFPLKP